MEPFLEWLGRQGHTVVRTSSTYWYEASPRIYQAVPYDHEIVPSAEEIQRLLLDQYAIGLRYSTPVDKTEGRLSYHVVNTNTVYDLAQLPKKARYDVRQGMEYAGVEPIPFSRLAEEGWSLREHTLERQGRTGAETRAWWDRLCRSAEGLPGFETWAAIHDGQLVASLIACTIDGCCSVLYQQSLTDALPHGVNNVLTYCFTKATMARPGVTKVFYGLGSLDASENVDRFKFRMNYSAQPVRQRVVFHPWIRWLFNGMSHGLLRAAKRRWPERSAISKAEGMLRFYLEGKKPLAEQTWPDCLAERRTQLLTPPLLSQRAAETATQAEPTG
jgi:hypothetical protein